MLAQLGVRSRSVKNCDAAIPKLEAGLLFTCKPADFDGLP